MLSNMLRKKICFKKRAEIQKAKRDFLRETIRTNCSNGSKLFSIFALWDFVSSELKPLLGSPHCVTGLADLTERDIRTLALYHLSLAP